MSDFVHLHLHSQYSLLDGANRIGDVVEAAGNAGMPAMALTDHGNMFGAIEFYKRARKSGVKPIVGIEAYTTRGDHRERTREHGGNNHLVLLARNETGYKNLIRLSSRAYLDGFYYKPRMDRELLREFSDGVTCLSACLKGELAEAVTSRRLDEAEKIACEYRDIFGEGNYYMEMQDHGIAAQHELNDGLRRLSTKTGIPLVVSNDCHYLSSDDFVAHDVLLCIGTQRMVEDTDRLRYASNNFYLKTAEEMFKLFPKDAAALENTVAIAEACSLDIEEGVFHLPEFPVPEGETLVSYFEKVARDGLEWRLEQLGRRNSRALAKLGAQPYWERLEREIRIIEEMGFPGYFLITWDFMRFSRENDIPVGPGRGSAAGSLVSYAMAITDVDPLEYDLLFERFLNPERISMPDIDIDFCMRRRGEVIQYVAEKYGRDHVAQIITFGTLAAKAAIRDVGRVMGVPYAKVNRIAKLVPDMTRSLAEAAREVDALKAEAKQDEEVAKIIEVGSRLEGLTRHASVHAAGVVITPSPLEDLVPLYKSSKDEVMTQWDKDVIEDLGLLKLDFLGLRTLTVIHDAVTILEQGGEEIDLERLTLDDAEVYRLFCEGRTDGIFQFESRGMKDLLRRAQPSKFEDLAAFNALYRPGALSVGMVEEYIQRKLGKKKVRYLLKETEPILEETYGVIVYQEQVMQIAVEVAGFTLGQADILRKAMGKKKVEVMAEQKQMFIDGAEKRGVAREKSKALWEYIEPFAGYGFNKSHSVAYALLAYKTAYLKAHHPVAFMAAMLNSELGSSDAIAKYVRECDAMDIEVLPPDVNESVWRFSVVGGAIRFGLGAVKGIGENAIEAVLGARKSVGHFGGLVQLATEVDLKAMNRKVFECLVKAGCFDSLDLARAPLFGALDEVLDYAQRIQRDREVGQESLFGGPAGEPEVLPEIVGDEWDARERLRYEKEVLGFYLTGNPLSEVQDDLEAFISHTTEMVNEGSEEEAVTLGGLVTDLRPTKIKSGPNAGRFMARFVLEDLHGRVPMMLFANTYEQYGSLLKDEAVVIVKGQPRARGSEVEVSALEVTPLEHLTGKKLTGIQVSLNQNMAPGRLLELKDLLIEHPGAVPVILRFEVDGEPWEVKTPMGFHVAFDADLAQSIQGLVGHEVEEVWV